MSDPLLFTLVQDLEFQTGYRIKQVVATRAEIVDAINRSYPDKALVRVAPQLGIEGRQRPRQPAPIGGARRSCRAEVGGIRFGSAADEDVFEQTAANKPATPETAPIIDMVELVIKSALKSRASDIHIEPTEGDVVVRHRLDGLLKEVMDLPKWVHEGVVARIKIMAGLDIAEKRLPQDGRIRATTEDGQEIDLRVSTLRTIFGEKIVLRVLDHRKGVPPLEELGLSGARDRAHPVLPAPSARDDSGRRTDRVGQDDDAVLGAGRASDRSGPTSSPSRIRSSTRFPASIRRRSTPRST